MMDRRIVKVLNYIESNLSKTHSLEKLSSLAQLSPSRFHRVFKTETNKTPFQFIEEIKLTKAHGLLIDGSDFVYEIAELLGYNDYETFSRAFKKQFHIAPDDLKTISRKLKEDIEIRETDEVFILASNDKDEVCLINELKQFLKDKNITSDDLKDAKVFKIQKKTNESKKSKAKIKNKYEIMSNKKIWETLIEKEK